MAKLRTQQFVVTDVDIVTSTTSPSSPTVGLRWYKPETAVTYQYTNDGTSSFWLDITSGGIGTSAKRGVDFVGDVDPGATTNVGVVGSVYYNREANRHFTCTTATNDAQVWNGNYAWLENSGGTIVNFSGYRYHTFLSSGSFVMDATTSCDYLVVAGGGGSGRGAGAQGANGGGGAGGLLTAASLSFGAATYTITVGDGGAGRSGSNGVGVIGGNSSIAGSGITDIVTTGGGFGGVGQGSSLDDGGPGGSGGGSGAASDAEVGGTRTASPVQGNNGGVQGGGGGGGGGGAGATGGTIADGNQGAPGGIGVKVIMGMTDANSTLALAAISAGHLSGSYRYFAGGGGGSNNSSSASGVGGLGGGGNGSGAVSSQGTVGTDGTGGGAGASGYQSQDGVDGGSGIVIIRYAI